MFIRTIRILLPLLIFGCSKEIKQEPHKQQSYVLSVESNTKVEPITDLISCAITPNILSEIKVPPIYKSNNLRRRIGYATYANGAFIRIDGILTDNQCVPVDNATIQIWHADANGIYKNQPENGYLYDNLMYSQQNTRFEQDFKNNSQADENFTGSGSTITDNLGRFSFLTIMPGSNEPLINLRVVHKDFSELNTILYFTNNGKIGVYLRKDSDNTVDNVKEVIYKYHLTLSDANHNKTY